MTPDPAGFVDSVNLYQYLYNNPHKYYDPTGKWFALVIPLFSVSFGVGAAAISLPSLITIAEIVTTAAIAYYAGEAIYQLNELDQGQKTEEEKKEKGPPPYKDLPDDPKQCPADGFEWRGDEKGAWHNPETKESLRAEFDSKYHPPHWDYTDRKTEDRARIFLDNTYEWK